MRWNVQSITFACVAGTQDYDIATTNFGTINEVQIQDPTTNAWYQLTYKKDLSLDGAQARPVYFSDHIDDGNGTITFRLMPVPDKAYNVNIHANSSATLFTSMNDTWGPIPDYMSYIYNWGFLSFMMMFSNDIRSTFCGQQFAAHLLANSEGLNELERNIIWDRPPRIIHACK